MPDFERILDKLSVDMAESPTTRSWQEGFVAGKTKARKEVLYVAIILAVCWVSLSLVGATL